MTDEEIFEGMRREQPDLESGLIEQIGPIIRREIDRDKGLITFYGEKKACSFYLGTVVTDLVNVANNREAYKRVTFE